MNSDKMYITKKGILLSAKSLQGKIIEFVSVEVGSGILAGELTEQENLIKKELEFEINSKKIVNDRQVCLSFLFTNKDLEQGFYFREIGIFAVDPDTSEKILYAYGNLGENAEYITIPTNKTKEKYININIAIDNAENVTININPNMAYVSQQEFNERIEDLDTKINKKADKKKTWNITLDTTWTGDIAPYTKTVTVTGLKETDEPNLIPIWSNSLEIRQNQIVNYGRITLANATDNGITFICDIEKPEIPLDIKVEVVY